eukprot:TRINITY_DN11_c0_g1_i3.p1 TRINITY_DN11_c0_g1~~TRINITY_DN11_c0_g1_i3.p1  ORF type:complete len:164 (+),score=51.71 TRINITY_DN11_c0_g1_i3:62-553(+)
MSAEHICTLSHTHTHAYGCAYVWRSIPVSLVLCVFFEQFVQKTTTRNKLGGPSITNIESDDSSSRIWWLLLQKAVERVGKKMEKPEIFPAATDARFVRNLGIPALGFSPMSNTPVLLHDHNEFLDTSEFLKGIEVYREMIELFAFAPSPHGGLPAAAPAHDDL